MSTPTASLLAAALAGLGLAGSAFGQGSLTPPGAPAPTMKTLAQVEPRTVVNATNTPGDAANVFIISQPGSYYLAANIAGGSGLYGIRITSGDVTLDLNGFTMVGGSGSLSGIIVPAVVSNVTVRNGTIRTWGQSAIDGSPVRNGSFEFLHVSGNTSNGIYAGSTCRVTSCVAQGNSIGITALGGTRISDCTTQGNGTGIFLGDLSGGGEITGCTAYANTGVGIQSLYGGAITHCNARRNGSAGISVSTGCSINDCTSTQNTGDGIIAFSRCRIMNNNSFDNGLNGTNGDGIETCGGDNRIEGNHCTGNNGRGIRSTGGDDFIVRNTCVGNSAGNYAPLTGPNIGPLGSASTSTNPWANF